MEERNKPGAPIIPGRVLSCRYDYEKRIVTFIVEHEAAPEAPEFTINP